MINNIITIYRRAGFQVVAALMDGEFEVLRGDMADMGEGLNTTA